ncbi:hypothetical protein evm_002957 [Chilo suppressalis]|nr:hypothetical protein evm_002957 [Chilo suppressalis]
MKFMPSAEFQKPKPPVQSDTTDEVRKSRKRRRPVGDIIKEYEGQQKSYMGNNELTKLWNLCPDNLAACRTKERDFMPSLEYYMVGVDRDARRTSCGGWGWRALRLLARRSPHFFVHTNNPIGRLPDYLDDMVIYLLILNTPPCAIELLKEVEELGSASG